MEIGFYEAMHSHTTETIEKKPAKTAEPIEMPWDVDSAGPKEPCIRWGPDRHT